MAHALSEFIPLNIAVLTVSDTRTRENDSSGDTLETLLTDAGHRCAERRICTDDVGEIASRVAGWVADPGIHVVITTGGTGMTARDSTPEAVAPLFERTIEGFGELFRQLSFAEIGSSTVQSRCTAGLANRTLIFCLPGSPNACRTGWNGILREQLDARHRPCNFVSQTGAGGAT
ncbi:MAG: molybdenum cofactor biosynthesis protein B [Xanthomonadales bacterium]|nr:molybdenum cofactor biosynthesis protein B [Xanthomonadales bacterium]NIN59795.1 molybdenum cofactor biosynthesis protein B [Xanthomonadales bacterium]NIN75170.1 molybdenum cofactor biosynthesis protein B [Xanthomonadales bacterium]NIO12756.1 molybdenum cofactor biosynthesis protein B [Xanthomonadales bacterium]NIP12188.1 molybdenum cofactor biosynthesis protein B [Xanthomonadales bacterium]